ncbi:MAG: hypothetical protein SV760_03525 [Halobacteria archaeon]|nr:hypothetical protein [Halobacteria archaeon]
MALTIGRTPGTEVTLEAGTISGIQVGAEEKLVIFARGDPSTGDAQVNSPTKVSTGGEAETEFGEGTHLTKLIKQALENGANASYLWGVMPATQSVTAESFAATQSFQLANYPIIEDVAELTIRDTVDSVDLTTEFHYQSPPATPSNADTAFVRPQSGEVEADSSSDYEVDYKYLDWASAFDAADPIVNEGESGVYWAGTDAESVAADVFTKAESLRDPAYKMVKAGAGAPPNANTGESPPDPDYDTSTYTDNLDSLPGFLFAPARQDDTTTTLLGAIAGKAAGNAFTNPIRGEQLSGVSIESGVDDAALLDFGERSDLRDAFVVPIEKEGSIELDGSLSTYEGAAWETDFQTVRVVDRCVLIVYEVGQAIMNRLDAQGLEDIAAEEAQAQLEGLADEGLIEPNTQDETNLYVRPVEDTPQGEIALEMGVTPVQAVDTFRTTITIG